LRVIEDHLGQLDPQMADLLTAHHDAVQRLAEVPGLGVDSAQQIIAEVGATSATFPSSKHLASWMGACPGNEESAGVNYSHRCPKGNRQMRRVLNQAANAAVKAKGTIFNVVYRRLVPRLGHAQAIGAITHRLCRLIWKILHERVRCEERGPSVWRALLTWIHRERYGDCSTASACRARRSRHARATPSCSIASRSSEERPPVCLVGARSTVRSTTGTRLRRPATVRLRSAGVRR
jgi:Transposase IS116/IS110/IS902 family